MVNAPAVGAAVTHRIALTVYGLEEAGRVRRVVGEWLDGRAVAGEGRDRVLVVLSELVANAVRHAPGWEVGVAVGAAGREVVVEVRDGSGREPVGGVRAGPEDESGRGLALVQALAADWGWAAHAGGGKTVWAVVRVAAAPPVCGRAVRLPGHLVGQGPGAEGGPRT
jgi:anti-sigma regulatory factor (Ser/Thr protein kinase)